MCKTIRLLLEHCSHHHRLNGAVLSFARAICVVIVAVAMIATGATAGAIAAEAVQRGIIAPGDAAVTGFSGAVSPAELPPGADPVPATVINLDGPTVRVIDLKQLGGPPAAQIVPAPKPYTATARQTGQVFGVALDNAVPPNIYVAATSVFGLPIVAAKTGSNGEPGRLFTGVPGAKFMPGLWGPAELGGGPGSIWRIDGASGSISLLANVKTGGVDNAGPALGGLAYHWSSNSLFVADRESGLIHRVGLDGTQRNSFDHGVIGRQAQGLDPVPDSPSQRLEITSPEFKNGDPLSWRLAPAARRIFGLGIRSGRLYYAVAYGLEIWSVGVSADGEFANDATFEMAVPLAAADAEISKIIFDDEGRMILAERAEPTGAAGFDALTAESSGRVLRYAITGHEPGKPRIWQQIPDSYAIGFPSGYRNGNGGVAIGFDYGADGIWQRTSCGGFLWSPSRTIFALRGLSLLMDFKAIAWAGFDRRTNRPKRPISSTSTTGMRTPAQEVIWPISPSGGFAAPFSKVDGCGRLGGLAGKAAGSSCRQRRHHLNRVRPATKNPALPAALTAQPSRLASVSLGARMVEQRPGIKSSAAWASITRPSTRPILAN